MMTNKPVSEKKQVKKRNADHEQEPHFYRGIFHAKTRFTSANTAETTPEIYQFLNRQFTGIQRRQFNQDTFKCKIADAINSVELYKYYNVGIQTKPYDFVTGGKRITGLRIYVTIDS